MEDKNFKFRPAMEDGNLFSQANKSIVYSLKDRFLSQDVTTGLFSLFDGHGGK